MYYLISEYYIMRLERIIKYILAKSISIIIRIILVIYKDANNLRSVKRLKRWRITIYPEIFDDINFLTYVKKKKHGLERRMDTIETLAIRGSNADYGFYSSGWDNSFNLGLISTDFYSSYQLYNNYRLKLRKLKNVLVFISVSSPGYSLIRTSERNRAIAYKYFFDIPYSETGHIKQKHEKWIFSKCDNLNHVKIDDNYSGYETKHIYGDHFIAKERVRTHLRENLREPDQMLWLNKFNESVKNDSRRLIIIIQPFKSDYKMLLPESNVLFRKFYSLNDIHILNYYDSDLFTDDDLGDTDHLNEQGAIKLTNEIRKYFEANNLL